MGIGRNVLRGSGRVSLISCRDGMGLLIYDASVDVCGYFRLLGRLFCFGGSLDYRGGVLFWSCGKVRLEGAFGIDWGHRYHIEFCLLSNCSFTVCCCTSFDNYSHKRHVTESMCLRITNFLHSHLPFNHRGHILREVTYSYHPNS